MRSPLIPVVLCLVVQAASAQSTTAPDTHPSIARTAAATTPHAAPATAANHRPGGELIKTAAAGTRDDGPPAARSAAPRPAQGEDHPRRGTAGMLLAALAMMTGIALRRFGGNSQ